MAEGGGGGMRRLIKIIVLVLVLLILVGAGIGATFWFLNTNEQAKVGGGSTASNSSEYLANPQFLDLGTFVVNLADGRRYLKTTLQLLLSEEKAKEYLKVRDAEVKDIVVSELQTLTSEQLRDPREREELKARLLSKIETLLPVKNRDWDDPKPIKKVLITEFYLQ